MFSRNFRAGNTGRYVAPTSVRNWTGRVGRPLPLLTQAAPMSNFAFKILPYVEATSLVSGVAGVTLAPQQWRLNSIFDPNLTGVGHQPYGHDEYEVFWNKYKVYRVDIEIEFTLPTASSGVYGVVAIQQPGDTYSYTGRSLNTVSEKPFCATIRVPNADGGSTKPATFAASYDMATLCGLTKTMFEADQSGYSGLMGSNPAGVPLLSVCTCNASATNSTSVVARCRINYHTMFYDRKTLARSS